MKQRGEEQRQVHDERQVRNKRRARDESWRDELRQVSSLHGRACGDMDSALNIIDGAVSSAVILEETVRTLDSHDSLEEVREAVKALKKARKAILRAFNVLADSDGKAFTTLQKAGKLHDDVCVRMETAVAELGASVDRVRKLERLASEGMSARFRLSRLLRIPAIMRTLSVAKDQVARTVKTARTSLRREATGPFREAVR